MAPKSCSSNEDQRFFQSRRLLLGVMGWGNHKMLVGSWGWSDKIGNLEGSNNSVLPSMHLPDFEAACSGNLESLAINL